MDQTLSSLEYNCRDLTHAPMLMQCLIHAKVNFEKKNPILPFEIFPILVLARNTIMLPHLIIHSSLHRRLKTKENFKLLAIKVVSVAYERLSLTRGGRLQVVPNTVVGHANFCYFRKLVGEERWSQPKIRLHFCLRPRINKLPNK